VSDDSLPDVIAALTTYRQADADGVMVLVSRQACDEAAAYLATAAARVEKYREALRRHAVFIFMTDWVLCNECRERWLHGKPEQHAPSCLLHEDSGRA